MTMRTKELQPSDVVRMAEFAQKVQSLIHDDLRQVNGGYRHIPSGGGVQNQWNSPGRHRVSFLHDEERKLIYQNFQGNGAIRSKGLLKMAKHSEEFRILRFLLTRGTLNSEEK